ncbi:MAG: FAD-dependent oxidoreductase [Myxococcales bacterium]|nr:FAD-dependent oxidoreductase [Myxococcales bacterium]
MTRKRILIVGGVAAGASCAARARRLDENAEIIVFEKGPHVSFANCGLPYHVGDVIRDESALLLVSPERFKQRFDIEVRVHNQVMHVDAEQRKVRVRHVQTGEEYDESYDALVLAPGAKPLRPAIPGIDLPGVFTLRTVPDTRRLREWIDAHRARRAVVVGAGFVGLEVAENLAKRGLKVQIIEREPQVLPPFDPEMARPVEDHLRQSGVSLILGHSLERIEARGDGLVVVVSGGRELEADLVILGLGVKPEVGLAEQAGVLLGPLSGIAVDRHMRTNLPGIWAAGDAVEDTCFVTGRPRLMPLAGPANRQGRIAADDVCGRPTEFRGVQGTVVCGLFGLTVAATGASQKWMGEGHDTEAVWLHPNNHVAYYPGAEPIHLKLVFARKDGRVLGAQAVGKSDVEKRIDVIAMAIQLGATVFDLEQAELCYAPQFGAAKDPVNIAGMIAGNVLRGDVAMARWSEVGRADVVLVDVRERDEFEAGAVPGALSVPLSELRQRIPELETVRELWVYCQSGKRSYDAARALQQRGFVVRNLPGGYESYRHQLESPPS